MLERFGYLPDIRFNTVIDMALKRQCLERSDIYVTQTFHLIPKRRSERIPPSAIRRSLTKLLNMSFAEGKLLHWAMLLLVNARGAKSSIQRSVIPVVEDVPMSKTRLRLLQP